MTEPDQGLNPETIDTQEAFLGELRLARRIGSTRQVVLVGLGVLLGIALLLGGGPERVLGRSLPLAGAIGLGAVGLSLLSILELLGGSSERGGSYGLVVETMGGLLSFWAGWAMLAAPAILAAAMLSAVAAGVSAAVPGQPAPNAVAIVLLTLACLMVLFPPDRARGPRGRALLLGIGLLLAMLLAAAAASGWRLPAASTLPPAALWQSAARLSLIYLGVEAVLSARRRIQMGSGGMQRSLTLMLMAAAALFVLPVLLAIGLSGTGAIWQAVPEHLPLPWLTQIVLGLVMFFSARALMTLVARGVYDMSRRGALPGWLRRFRRPFRVPPMLVLAASVAVVALLLLGGRWPLVEVAAGLVLSTGLLIHVAAIYSRQTEPDRRRSLVLPLHPLIPSIGVVVNASLLINLGANALLAVAGLFGLGTLVYLAYARRHQVAAQEGVSLFGSDRSPSKQADVYRVLVPLAPGDERTLVLELAVGLARQLGGEVLPLQVIPVPDPLAMEEARRIAWERNAVFRWSTRLATQLGVKSYPITRLARTVEEGILDTAREEECDLLLLPWQVTEAGEANAMGGVLEAVVSKAPCDAAVVAFDEQVEQLDERAEASGLSESRLNRILVPTAGGPHAPLAVGLAFTLARAYDASVMAVYVAPEDSSEAEIEAGEARIESTLEAMQGEAAKALLRDEAENLGEGVRLERRVILDDDVVNGIARASHDADLAFIGASEEGMIDQVLFGNLPRQVAAACQAPLIMVRRYRGLPRFWLQRIWDSLFQALPNLSSADQIDLYKRTRRGARPDVDFFVMMGLSATIASFGLLLNSGAVIIGAMLVAPLFTPILAFSLAITMGDVRMVRLAIEASLKGVFLAIGVSLLIGILTPLPLDLLDIPEIAARVRPNLLDLAVALAAGAAGAYAIARKDVAAALPGVAIAAALVPPLSVIGISLAAGAFASAGGATLLVVTNLIAISLAGAITLLLLGFRPASRSERQERLRTGLAATLGLLLLISIPLAGVLVRSVQRAQLQQRVTETLIEQLSLNEDVELAGVEIADGGEVLAVTATVYQSVEHGELAAAALADLLAEEIGEPIRLRLLTLPALQVESGAATDG